MTVEECLRELSEKAALLRYLASSATVNSEPPDDAVLAGMDTLCTEIEDLAVAVKRSLDVTALDVKVKRRSVTDAR